MGMAVGIKESHVMPNGYDDVNGANGWEFENSVANMNFDDGSSETWYLVNGNIIKRVRTP